jgi:hypothetical protein
VILGVGTSTRADTQRDQLLKYLFAPPRLGCAGVQTIEKGQRGGVTR